MLGYPRNEAKPSAYLYLCFLAKFAGEDGFPVSRETRISRHRRPPAGAEDLGGFDQLVRTQRQAQADIRPPGLADAVKIVAGPAGLRSPESKDPSGSAGLMGKGNQDLIGPAGLIGKRCRDETSRARGLSRRSLLYPVAICHHTPWKVVIFVNILGREEPVARLNCSYLSFTPPDSLLLLVIAA